MMSGRKLAGMIGVVAGLALIGYSLLNVEYYLAGEKVSELLVTQWSIPHAVIRTPDGRLTTPGEEREMQAAARQEAAMRAAGGRPDSPAVPAPALAAASQARPGTGMSQSPPAITATPPVTAPAATGAAADPGTAKPPAPADGGQEQPCPT